MGNVCDLWVFAVAIFLAFAITDGTQTFHLAFLADENSQSSNLASLHFPGTQTGFGELDDVTVHEDCKSAIMSGFSSDDQMTIDLPRSSCADLVPSSPGIHENYGVRVTTNDDDKVIHVHQHYRDSGLTEGYLAIADDNLGMEYYVITYCSTGGTCQFAVTPVEDATSVLIKFPDGVQVNGTCISGVYQSTVAPGTELPFTINELDVLYFKSSADLTGTRIVANKKVAVFAGSSGVPDKDDDTTTLMIEQLPPVEKWYRKFVMVPSGLNEAGDLVKIVASVGHTKVYITGFSPFMIPSAGGSVLKRIDKEMNSYIETSYPVLVVQIIGVSLYNTTPSDVTSSLSMVLVPAIEHWLTTVSNLGCTWSSQVTMMIASHSEYTEYTLTRVEGTDYSGGTESGSSVTDTGDNKIGVSCAYASGPSLLLDVDWTQTTQGCVQTPAVPGDDVDNDCDGLIDEDTCTLSDLKYSFNATQDQVTGAYSVGYLNIEGVKQLRFDVTSCGGVSTLQFTTADYPEDFCSIQISHEGNINVVCSNGNPDPDELTITSECTKINFLFKMDATSANTHTLSFWTADTSSQEVTITTTPPNEYTSLFMTSHIAHTVFNIELPQKDCKKFYYGAGIPDHFGTEFIVPVSNDDNAYTMVITAGEQSAMVVIKYGDSSVATTINVTAGDTQSITRDNIAHSTYSLLYLKSDVEVKVYLRLGSSGLNLIPVDVLGPSYQLYYVIDTDVGAVSIACDVYSLDTPTVILTPSSTPLEPYQKHPLAVNTELGSFKVIEADKPVAVFCKHDSNTLIQLSPRETLGRKFYIPAISEPPSFISATLRIITSEDSTVDIIKGDYHNLDTFTITGSHFTREYVFNEEVWQIDSTKPILVHLEIKIDTPTTYLLPIPPTDQYANTSNPHPFSGPSVTRYGVTDKGEKVADRESITTPHFTITVLNDANTNPPYDIVAGEHLFQDNNEVCVLSVATTLDNKDNDCDGLIDEEVCDGHFDYDIDGSLYDDCSNGSVPNQPITLGIPSTSVDCQTVPSTSAPPVVTPSPGAGTGFTSITPSVTWASPSAPVMTPDVPPTFVNFTTALPSVQLPFSTDTSSSSNATNTTTEACTSECLCPCGWILAGHNYTEEELAEVVAKIQEKLKLTKSELSSTIRKKSSAKDNRKSSTAVGYVGLATLVVFFGSIVFLDFSSLVRDVKMLVENVQEVFDP